MRVHFWALLGVFFICCTQAKSQFFPSLVKKWITTILLSPLSLIWASKFSFQNFYRVLASNIWIFFCLIPILTMLNLRFISAQNCVEGFNLLMVIHYLCMHECQVKIFRFCDLIGSISGFQQIFPLNHLCLIIWHLTSRVFKFMSIFLAAKSSANIQNSKILI